MRTIIEYEGSDVDFDDPVHAYLAGCFTLFALNMIKGDRPGNPEAAEAWMKERVAEALNGAQTAGIKIIPTTFTVKPGEMVA